MTQQARQHLDNIRITVAELIYKSSEGGVSELAFDTAIDTEVLQQVDEQLEALYHGIVDEIDYQISGVDE